MSHPCRYRELVEALSQVVYEVGPNGRLTYVNAVAEEIFGITPSLLEDGLTVADLLIPEDRERAGNNIARIMRGEVVGANEYTVVGPNGRSVPVLIDSRAIVENGEIRGLRGVVVDITRQRELDAELHAASRLASIGTLAAGLAHEINNPLTSVLGNVEVLREVLEGIEPRLDAAGGSTIRGLIEDLLAGTKRVASITRDLSVLARADDGPPQPVQIDAAVEHAMVIARNQVAHTATIRTEGTTDLKVLGHEHRLIQVFSNLLANAAQSLPQSQDGHEIVVSLREDGDRVSCEVWDTGPGIPESLLPTVFEPFVTGRAEAGTGMGLAICKRIVDSMSGKITARNRAEGGASFEIRLPISRELPVPHDDPAPVDLVAVRVLVVDDDVAVRRVMGRILHDAELVFASKGSEALERLEDSEFDVVLCDLMMPGLSGVEVYRRAKAARPEQAKRFVFITGGAFRPESESFLRTVDVPVVNKPFEGNELRRLVLQIAQSGSGSSRSSRPS